MTATTYLDYNATAPLRGEAREAMLAAMELPGNASSVHAFGRDARAVVETAREEIAEALGAKPSEVIFTSGASEANNWIAMGGWASVCLSAAEHDSVFAPMQRHAKQVFEASVDKDGVVSAAEIADWALLSPICDEPRAISVQMANNETGVVQPVGEIAEFARGQGIFMHTDAVQAVGRIDVNFRRLGADAMSITAHKFGGPKGIGALILAEDAGLAPLLTGGGQERRRRAGTENIAAIAGFAAALKAALRDFETIASIERLRDKLEAGLKAGSPDVVILSEHAPRLVNTTCFVAPGKRSETMLIKLDLDGVAVSSGAACSSGKVGVSRMINAVAGDADWAQSVLRVSIGHATTDAEIDRFLESWKTLQRSDKVAA